MALTSVFYDGVVTEGDRARNRAGTPDYGVYGQDDFKVTSHPSIPYAVLVKLGKAHGHGVTDTAATDQVLQCATLSSGVRWDAIVVRRNWQPLGGGPSTLVAVSAGSTAILPPALKSNPGVEDDQPIALVKWQGGTSAPVEIIDLRCWAANGGVVAADLIARGYLAKPGADVRIGSATWRYTLGANSVWGWAKDPEVVIEIGQGSNVPVFKSKEVPVTLNNFLVGDIYFDTPFPNALVSVGLERRWTTALATTFTIISNSALTNRARVQFVASGASPGSTVYVTYQAWGY